MVKRWIWFAPLVLTLAMASVTFALDKVKLGTSVKMSPIFYLPNLIAEDRGIWKANGLDVEWIPFAGGAGHMHGFAAGAVNFGLVAADLPLMAADKGLPVVLVAELVSKHPFDIWVRTETPYRNAQDLKGARIAVTQLGGAPHTYGRIIAKAHGINVRFIGAGGVPEQIAGIRVKAFEGVSLPLETIAGLVVAGVVRRVASPADYLPTPWFERAVLARKEYVRANPDISRRMVKSIVQTMDFMRKNPRATMDAMKNFQKLPEEGAKLVYDTVQWSSTGRLDRKAVENVRNIFIEYGIISAKAPPVDELFTNEYVP